MKNPPLIKFIIDKLEDLKATDIKVLDVRGQTSVTDYMIIAIGTSTQHVRSIAEYVMQEAKKNKNISVLGIEGEDFGEWVLLDLNDAIVHIMLPKVRDYYELEKLWSVETENTAATPAGKKLLAKTAANSSVNKKTMEKKMMKASTAKKPVAEKVVKAPVAKKPAAKKAAVKKPAAKKAAVKKPAAKKVAVKKPAAKKAAVKKPAAKKAAVKK